MLFMYPPPWSIWPGAERVGCAAWEWAKWRKSADEHLFSQIMASERHAPSPTWCTPSDRPNHTIVPNSYGVLDQHTVLLLAGPLLLCMLLFRCDGQQSASGPPGAPFRYCPWETPYQKGAWAFGTVSECSVVCRGACAEYQGVLFAPSFSVMMKPSYAFGCRHPTSPHCDIHDNTTRQ